VEVEAPVTKALQTMQAHLRLKTRSRRLCGKPAGSKSDRLADEGHAALPRGYSFSLVSRRML
jgi:hypothetical protein